MMQLVPTLALLALTLLRVPAVRRDHNDPVFYAGLLAFLSMGLNIDAVYMALDPLLGGENLLNLAVHLLLIFGLWFLRSAILAAVSVADHSMWTMRSLIPFMVTCVAEVMLFVAADLPVSAAHFADTYGDQLAVTLYSGFFCLYMAWVFSELLIGGLRHSSMMSGSFRIAFLIIMAGCIAAVFASGAQIVNLLLRGSTDPAAIETAEFCSSIYNAGQMLAALAMGVGLSIPPAASMLERRRHRNWLAATHDKVEQIWQQSVPADVGRGLPEDQELPVRDRLHRMIVEIRDNQLSAAVDRPLTPEEEEYLSEVEYELNSVAV